MWHYENHLEEDYISAIKRVEQIAVELGAEFVCIKKENRSWFLHSLIIK